MNVDQYQSQHNVQHEAQTGSFELQGEAKTILEGNEVHD